MFRNCRGLAGAATAVVLLGPGPVVGLAQSPWPDAGTVAKQHRITQFAGGFTGQLDEADNFGTSIAVLGDLDADGVVDLAVSAITDDDGGTNRGAVWILFLNADGTVRSHQKISSLEGGFTGVLDANDYFGATVAALGDLDVDGTPDLAVTAPYDDDGGADRGAVWILFLNADGTVRAHQKISSTQGGFGPGLDNGDFLGWGMAGIGDLDADGTVDLAVAAVLDDDGGTDRGAVWILFLNPDGTVRARQKISSTQGGFAGTLRNGDQFGLGQGGVGDFDQDGVVDLAVGAVFDDDAGPDGGAVWILYLNANGTVRQHRKISSTQGGFTGVLDDADYFGASVANIGDIDADGVDDLLVGSHGDNDGGADRGSAWILLLNADESVKAARKISQTQGGLSDALTNGIMFGRSVAHLGDLDGDGRDEVAVGAVGFPVPTAVGEVWMLSLNDCSTVPVITSDPASTLLPQAGGKVTLSVAAAGSPTLEYRWRRDGVDLVDGGHVSGASTPTLTIGATRADIGFYDCVVSNKAGSVTSRAALLGLRLDCIADFNNDGVVNSTDVSDFINAWFENQAGCP